MDEGTIVEEGLPADVLDRPQKEHTQRFLRAACNSHIPWRKLTIDEGGTAE